MKIYEPKGKAREYSPLALNYYKGCTHNCLYCYVQAMFNRFDKNYKHSIIGLRKSINIILKNIENSAMKYENSKDQVLLNFTSDPYNAMESKVELTRQVLKILLKYNIPVSILSKGGNRILRDIDLFKEFGENIIVGQTLTFLNEVRIKEITLQDPRASPPVDSISRSTVSCWLLSITLIWSTNSSITSPAILLTAPGL